MRLLSKTGEPLRPNKVNRVKNTKRLAATFVAVAFAAISACSPDESKTGPDKLGEYQPLPLFTPTYTLDKEEVQKGFAPFLDKFLPGRAVGHPLYRDDGLGTGGDGWDDTYNTFATITYNPQEAPPTDKATVLAEFGVLDNVLLLAANAEAYESLKKETGIDTTTLKERISTGDDEELVSRLDELQLEELRRYSCGKQDSAEAGEIGVCLEFYLPQIALWDSLSEHFNSLKWFAAAVAPKPPEERWVRFNPCAFSKGTCSNLRAPLAQLEEFIDWSKSYEVDVSFDPSSVGVGGIRRSDGVHGWMKGWHEFVQDNLEGVGIDFPDWQDWPTCFYDMELGSRDADGNVRSGNYVDRRLCQRQCDICEANDERYYECSECANECTRPLYKAMDQSMPDDTAREVQSLLFSVDRDDRHLLDWKANEMDKLFYRNAAGLLREKAFRLVNAMNQRCIDDFGTAVTMPLDLSFRGGMKVDISCRCGDAELPLICSQVCQPSLESFTVEARINHVRLNLGFVPELKHSWDPETNYQNTWTTPDGTVVPARFEVKARLGSGATPHITGPGIAGPVQFSPNSYKFKSLAINSGYGEAADFFIEWLYIDEEGGPSRDVFSRFLSDNFATSLEPLIEPFFNKTTVLPRCSPEHPTCVLMDLLPASLNNVTQHWFHDLFGPYGSREAAPGVPYYRGVKGIETTGSEITFDTTDDIDGDGVSWPQDNCPYHDDPSLDNDDDDDLGDACDPCPFFAGPAPHYGDFDGDGVCDDVDNCLGVYNPAPQRNTNETSERVHTPDAIWGDACDPVPTPAFDVVTETAAKGCNNFNFLCTEWSRIENNLLDIRALASRQAPSETPTAARNEDDAARDKTYGGFADFRYCQDQEEGFLGEPAVNCRARENITDDRLNDSPTLAGEQAVHAWHRVTLGIGPERESSSHVDRRLSRRWLNHNNMFYEDEDGDKDARGTSGRYRWHYRDD